MRPEFSPLIPEIPFRPPPDNGNTGSPDELFHITTRLAETIDADKARFAPVRLLWYKFHAEVLKAFCLLYHCRFRWQFAENDALLFFR